MQLSHTILHYIEFFFTTPSSQQQAREQVAAAKEKKKSKKSKKHEKWLKEQQMQQEDRAKSWTDKVNREEEKRDAISDLIGTEFRRVNKGVIINDETQKVITEKSREAHDALYGSNIKCRVEVVGSERKDLNGRKGSIRHWDENKGQFCVGLDTKKSRDCDVYFFKPENLDVVTPAQSASKKDGKLAANFIVSITGTTTQGGDGIACQFSLKKSDITKLESAHSRSKGLQEFFEERDALAHRLMKEQEEQRKEEERLEKEEEEDRKRRAEIKAKKRAEKELKKEEQRRRRENAFKRSQEKARREKATEMIHELQISIRKAVLTQKVGAAYEAYFRMWASDGGSLEGYPPPPFFIDFVQVGTRVGWRWNVTRASYSDSSNSCEINWLDPEPDSESNDYDVYIRELQSIQEDIFCFEGYQSPPSEEEYKRLCEEYYGI